MALITVPDHDSSQPTSDERRIWSAADINHFKAVINANQNQFVENEVPSGSGTSFSLANTPAAGSLKLFRNGLRQVAPADYSISGSTITLTSTIGSDSLLADYRKAT